MELLRFSREHLWIRVENEHARIGLSDHGQEVLGEATAFQLPEIGDVVERGETFSEVESRRTVAELSAPVSGRVTAVNVDLEDDPVLVNEDPHDAGWLIEVDLADERELDELLDSDEYEALVAEEVE